MNEVTLSALKYFTYYDSSVLKSGFLFITSVAECANSSVCTTFSVVKVCSGEVAVLVSLKLYNTYSLNKHCKFKASVVVVDHVLADTVTNSLLEYF